MYTLAKTFAQLNGAGSYWEEIEAGSIPLIDLFDKYRSLRLELLESFSGEEQIFDLYTLKDELETTTLTLSDWLTSIGNRNLRAVKGTLSLKTSKLYSYDTTIVDFLPRCGNTGYHPSNSIPLDEQTDILLTRPNTDYINVGKHCLFTVGGYFHRHEYGSTGVYVVGGNKTTLRSGAQEVGMLDFSRIGEVEIFPMKEDYLMAPTTMLPYRESIYMKLPKPKTDDVTIAFVFGGYLHLLDNVFTLLSDDAAALNLQAMNLHSRFFRSRLYLDLTALEATVDLYDQSSDLLPRILMTDAALKAWVLHENSFFVYIKANSLQVTEEALPRPSTPGRYFLGRNPEGVIKMDFGEMPAFIQTKEPPIWLLSTMWEERTNTLYETTNFKDSRYIVMNDTPYLHRTHDPSLATLMQVHRIELVETK